MIISAGGRIGEQSVDGFLEEVSLVIKAKEVNRVFMKSVEPPSFIQILAEAVKWIDPLKIAVTAFFAQLAKEAAKDLWKNKERIASVLGNATIKPLKIISSAIARQLKAAAGRNFRISVGFPYPDDYFGTLLTFTDENEEEIAWAIAQLVNQAEQIEKIVLEEMRGPRPPLGMFQLHLSPEGQFTLKWIDNNQMRRHERTV